jgi:CBS domain-containing protein
MVHSRIRGKELNMESLQLPKFLETDMKDLLIPAERVAHVQLGNPVEHALLVLIKSGYSAIPVLDANFKLCGLISKTMILELILGIEQIEFEKLSDYKVEDALNTEIPNLKVDDLFVKGLSLSVDHPFLCVVDNEETFVGILTRRAILKLMMQYVKEYNKKGKKPVDS